MKKWKQILLVACICLISVSSFGCEQKQASIIKNENKVEQMEEEPPVQEENQETTEQKVEQPVEPPIEQPKPITPTPSVQPTTPTVPTKSPYPYYIKVNRLANCVTIYQQDEQGDFTIPIKSMVCSVGKDINKTPVGVFKTSDKYVWRALFGNQYGQYATRIKGNILFHSVPYSSQSKDSLKTEYYNNLGVGDSMGCIRLACADAKWIYDNCAKGTTVEIYDDANPGPLGKPTAEKIDLNSPYAGWDPTDPDPNNPWKMANTLSITQEKIITVNDSTTEVYNIILDALKVTGSDEATIQLDISSLESAMGTKAYGTVQCSAFAVDGNGKKSETIRVVVEYIKED